MSVGVTIAALGNAACGVTDRFARMAQVIAPLVLRAALAIPFFKSGLTKWDGFLTLSPAAAYLFEDEFKLHLFGQAYDFPMPVVVASLVGLAEIILPILLICGLATRFSALALLAMTGVIQLVVPEGLASFHLPWAAIALALIAIGPGPLSIDRLIATLWRAMSGGKGSGR
jgi:putative oxidoreductase